MVVHNIFTNADRVCAFSCSVGISAAGTAGKGTLTPLCGAAGVVGRGGVALAIFFVEVMTAVVLGIGFEVLVVVAILIEREEDDEEAALFCVSGGGVTTVTWPLAAPKST